MGHLEEKTVIVTGAARGLGRAYAESAAAEGAHVVLTDVLERVEETADEVRRSHAQPGREVSAHVGTVTDPGFCDSLVEATEQRYGRVDALINNAGLYLEGRFWDLDPAQVERLVTVNVLGAMFMGRAVGASMVKRGAGAILNISSGASFGYPMVSAYSASKGAVASMTYSWALDALDRGIRVNAMSPVANTAMTATTEFQSKVVSDAPEPSAMAPLATYLISDAAAGITGQFFRFNGRDLHVVAHPGVKEPVVTRDSWTFDVLAEVIDGRLSRSLERIGVWQAVPPRLAEATEV
ncbi:SDR family oxidoreductase [Dactylosporangium sp. AC04546]|uniref:SDR family NAD(P)-dependent oxidoreductase n=1 Tax=Dactylosporangium sp. AC04546 TaxID=2862460 RepID=UPI001EDF32D1|nr:SDR family oxidoreductase [Dactylosporangium sp. AC04546]WVK86829.1 SDR family oxidoreductase [Dactylosporangium sp. AC04546]